MFWNQENLNNYILVQIIVSLFVLKIPPRTQIIGIFQDATFAEICSTHQVIYKDTRKAYYITAKCNTEWGAEAACYDLLEPEPARVLSEAGSQKYVTLAPGPSS